jgi:hypothetical protein
MVDTSVALLFAAGARSGLSLGLRLYESTEILFK